MSFQTFFLTQLYVWCVFVYRIWCISKSIFSFQIRTHTHAHIKLSEKQLIKTSYGSTTLSNVPFSKQSKMLPGKIPTFKLNNNESRLLCQDKNRNICARRSNLLIYSQLRDNILMNKTKFSSRITQRENQAHMCHSRVPGAGGLSPTPVSTQTLGKKANVVHRKIGKESQKIKDLPDKIIGRAGEKPQCCLSFDNEH